MGTFTRYVVGGAGVGTVPKYVGYYSMELYFYSQNQDIKDLVLSIDWKKEVNSISAKNYLKV